ncbi:MAG: 50S ribosomal protein L18Ae [Candidatus Methanomethylophilus sp.]|jgi:large subunit ribosomal protein LX|nr:50S ribosomal protein L18Ae [Methanomethylophilus sp.]
MKAFLIKGTHADKRQGRQIFSVEMAAEDEATVREKALSTLGSQHKLKRRDIEISEITEIPADQITNHVVKYQIGE